MGVVYGLRADEFSPVRYVGLTTRKLTDRLSGHRHAAFTKKLDIPVTRWIRSHGRWGFEAIVLFESDSRAELQAKEIELIESLKTHESVGGLNITRGGDGSLGVPRTAEQIESQRQKMLGVPRPPEVIARVAAANRGRRHGPETRARMSAGARRRAMTEGDTERRSLAARKFSDDQERAIWHRYQGGGVSQRQIAREFGLSQAGVCRILKRLASAKIEENVHPLGDSPWNSAPSPSP